MFRYAIGTVLPGFRALLLLLIVTLASGPLHAEPGGLAPGIWHGMLGKERIVACFDGQSAKYYYPAHPRDIILRRQGDGVSVWLEGDPARPTGAWNIVANAPGRASGLWSDREGGQSLPIRLTSAWTPPKAGPGVGRGNGCGQEGRYDNLYHYLPRVLAEPVAAGQVRAMNGQRYRRLSAFRGKVNSIELLGKDARTLAMQKRLRDDFQRDMADYALACNEDASLETRKWSRNTLDRVRVDVDLTYLNAQWLSLRKSYDSDFCPGAHPARGCIHMTWNRSTLEETSPWQWISNKGKRGDRGDEGGAFQVPTDALARLIQGSQPQGSDRASDYETALDGHGMIFSLAGPGDLCLDDIVPYQRLAPFLNAMGQDVIREILRSDRKRRTKRQVSAHTKQGRRVG